MRSKGPRSAQRSEGSDDSKQKSFAPRAGLPQHIKPVKGPHLWEARLAANADQRAAQGPTLVGSDDPKQKSFAPGAGLPRHVKPVKGPNLWEARPAANAEQRAAQGPNASGIGR